MCNWSPEVANSSCLPFSTAPQGTGGRQSTQVPCSASLWWCRYFMWGPAPQPASYHKNDRFLSETCKASSRVGLRGGHFLRAIFLPCCWADKSTAPPVQLYPAVVTKPTTVLVVLGNHSALLTLPFLWQWQQTSDSLWENTKLFFREIFLNSACLWLSLFCQVSTVKVLMGRG